MQFKSYKFKRQCEENWRRLICWCWERAGLIISQRVLRSSAVDPNCNFLPSVHDPDPDSPPTGYLRGYRRTEYRLPNRVLRLLSYLGSGLCTETLITLCPCMNANRRFRYYSNVSIRDHPVSTTFRALLVCNNSSSCFFDGFCSSGAISCKGWSEYLLSKDIYIYGSEVSWKLRAIYHTQYWFTSQWYFYSTYSLRNNMDTAHRRCINFKKEPRSLAHRDSRQWKKQSSLRNRKKTMCQQFKMYLTISGLWIMMWLLQCPISQSFILRLEWSHKDMYKFGLERRIDWEGNKANIKLIHVTFLLLSASWFQLWTRLRAT